MYAQYFGLKQAPFSIAPDPRYLFMSERHREALAHLLYGVGGGGGFVVLTGEIGAGKTTVCRCFLEQIPRRTNVAYIFNPKVTVAELLKSICDEFRIPYEHQGTGQATIKDYVDPLNEFLLKTHAVGQNNVLIIDEAQNLSTDVLEQLRLLTNLETSERKLLQIMLIGQPELRALLSKPELEQLAQRVIAHFHLDALTEDETAQYIQHRLAVAGLKRGRPFERDALKRIHQLSRGVPRRINLLCDRALLGAYAENKNRVDRNIVDKAAKEVFQVHQALSQGLVPAASSEDTARPASSSSSSSAPSTRASRRAERERNRQKRQSPDWRPWAASGLLASAFITLGVAAWVHQHQPATHGAASPASHNNGAASGAPPATAGMLAAGGTVSGAASQPAGQPQAATAGSGAVVGQMSTTLATTLTPQNLADISRTGYHRESQALRALAALWHVTLGEGDPCAAAAQQQMACFKNTGGLSLVRQLDRPVVLELADDKGQALFGVLTRLQDQSAVIQLETQTITLPTSALATLWRGDFITLWRTPPAFRGKVLPGQSGPTVDWLAAQMARLDRAPAPSGKQIFDPALQGKVYAFQMSQGLKPDGVVGATTFMLLNRATGVDEPRLLAVAQAARR
jgi:general secretion pathway protein A